MSYRASCVNTNNGPTRQLTCAVERKHWDVFDEIARRMDMNKAEIMRQIVMRFIKENHLPKTPARKVKHKSPSTPRNYQPVDCGRSKFLDMISAQKIRH